MRTISTRAGRRSRTCVVYFAREQMNAGWAINMSGDAYPNLPSPMRIRGIGVHRGSWSVVERGRGVSGVRAPEIQKYAASLQQCRFVPLRVKYAVPLFIGADHAHLRTAVRRAHSTLH